MVLDRKISKFISIVMVAFMGIVIIASLFRPAYSAISPTTGGTPTTTDPIAPTGGGGSTDFSTLIENAEQATENVSEGFYKVAMTLGPLALIVCLVIILFSHDSRKVSMLIGICVTIIIAWLCIMIVHNGWLKDFLVSITDKYFS